MVENIYLWGHDTATIYKRGLKRHFRGLNVALITVILNVVKTIPNMMKSSVYCKKIAGVVDAIVMVTALVFR